MTAMANLTTLNLNFLSLTDNPDTAVVERFISSMFWEPSTSLNDAKLEFFLHKGKQLTKLPMTSHTFINKLKRSMYQASVWNQSISKATILPDPRNWGYAQNESGKNLEFDWGTQLDIISAKKWDTFRSYSCKTECTTNGRCGCHKQIASSSTSDPVLLKCTTLYKCPCNQQQ